MKRVRYTKYTGDLASEMSMDDLLKALSDYLLDSGFRDPFSRFAELMAAHDRAPARGVAAGAGGGRPVRQRHAAADRRDGRERQARRVDRQADRAHGAGELHLHAGPRRIRPGNRRAGRPAWQKARSGSKSPTRASIFWASRLCAICLARWANRALDGMTRGIGPRASKPAALPRRMNLATR